MIVVGGNDVVIQPAKNNEVRIYFAFPDGVFHYVCAECTALCCRAGLGLQGSLRRELKPLLSIYPQFAGMAIARHGHLITFSTPVGQCFFLDRDNLCRIEKEHGQSLKPGVCLLYPFNNITRIGNAIAVSPQFSCPLRFNLPARPGEVGGTHAAIKAAIYESTTWDSDYVTTYLSPARLHPSFDADSVLEREEEFRELCTEKLGKAKFVELLSHELRTSQSLELFIERSLRIMEMEIPVRVSVRDPIDDLLIALASSLRLYLLQLSSENILRALALGEVLLRQVTPLSNLPATPQVIHRILSSLMPVLALLARGDERIELNPRNGFAAPQFGDSALTVAVLVALRELQKGAKVFDALERAMTPLPAAIDRMLLLNHLGTQIGYEIGRQQSKTKRVNKNK